MRIALAITPDHHAPDDDAPLVEEALKARGVDVSLKSWYDPHIDWSSFDKVVLKSAWNIYDDVRDTERFYAWLEMVNAQTRLLNPAEVIRWTLDKRYLVDLANKGVAVVPTRLFEISDKPEFPEGEFVVKPVTSAGARMSGRYVEQHDEAVEHVRVLHRRGLAAIVQPYVRSLDTEGERALVFFGGTFSHAIRKQAVLQVGQHFDEVKQAHPSPQSYEPTDDELKLAMRTFDAVTHKLSHARVDIVTLDDGQPGVMEVEFIDPRLFFQFEPLGPARMAEAIIAF